MTPHYSFAAARDTSPCGFLQFVFLNLSAQGKNYGHLLAICFKFCLYLCAFCTYFAHLSQHLSPPGQRELGVLQMTLLDNLTCVPERSVCPHTLSGLGSGQPFAGDPLIPEIHSLWPPSLSSSIPIPKCPSTNGRPMVLAAVLLPLTAALPVQSLLLPLLLLLLVPRMNLER